MKKRSLKERRRRAKTLVVAGIAVAGLLMVGLAVWGMHQPSIRVRQVTIAGTNLVREDLVKRVVDDTLAGSYFLIIPRANTFVYPRTEIEERLVDQFHPIKSVFVERVGLTAVSVYVTERVPHALWCKEVDAIDECYFMDDEGLIFARAHDAPPELLTFRGGGVTRLGDRYVAGAYEQLYAFVNRVSGATERTPREVAVDAEGDAYVTFAEGGELRLVAEEVGDPLLDTIASVFASRKFEGTPAFDYADFRFGNKIYVKWRE